MPAVAERGPAAAGQRQQLYRGRRVEPETGQTAMTPPVALAKVDPSGVKASARTVLLWPVSSRMGGAGRANVVAYVHHCPSWASSGAARGSRRSSPQPRSNQFQWNRG